MIKTLDTKKLPSYNDNLENTFKKSITLNLPVALWKLPDSLERHLVVDFSHGEEKVDFDFGNSTPGFLIAPFLPEHNSPYIIKADFYLNSLIDKPILKTAHPELLAGKITELLNISREEKLTVKLPSLHEFNSSNKHHYVSTVENARKEIQNNFLKKVVIARNKTKIIKSDVDIISIFNELCYAYPNALVSLISHPVFGCWVGASPEILLEKTAEGQLKTVALAGTQKVENTGLQPEMISWQQKEIEEQALVSRYIINCFKSIRLREFEEDGPKTIFSGNLAHLKTDFSIKMADISIKNLGNTLLNLLHPTSAVGGMPRENAISFIKENEDFERGLYSGYLGPVNIKNETSLFVNIRCARIYHNAVLLFAGAGITLGSDPEKEWEETEEKMKFIESLFD